MSGIGAFLWVAYLAVAMVFVVEIVLIVLRSRNIERFIGDLGEEPEATEAQAARPRLVPTTSLSSSFAGTNATGGPV